MTTGPGGYGRLAPAALACVAVVCGGLWLASGSPAAPGAFLASLHAASANETPADRAAWSRSSVADVNSPDDDDDDDVPAAGAVIVPAPHGAAGDAERWEPVALEDLVRVATGGDTPALRGPPALNDEDSPISSDDDDEDDGDQDDAIAEFITAPDPSIHSIDLADVTPASAFSFVSRRPALRAPPVSVL